MVVPGKNRRFGILSAVASLFCVLLLSTVGCALGGSNENSANPPDAPLEALSTIGADGTIDKDVSKGKSRKPKCIPGAEIISDSEPFEVRCFDDGSHSDNGPIVKWEWIFSGPEHDKKPKHKAWEEYTDTLGEAFHTYTKARGTMVAHLRVTDMAGRTSVNKIKIKSRHGDAGDDDGNDDDGDDGNDGDDGDDGGDGDPDPDPDPDPGTDNEPPIAVATADPSVGVSPLIVGLSAIGSNDPDGTIATYEWDPGDGSGFTDATATSGEINWGYDSEGSYTAVLRVTDNLGAQASASEVLTILPLPITNWDTRLIDTNSSSGSWSSLNVIAGNPGVSYYDAVNGDLKYSHSTVEFPTEASHWMHHTVDAEGIVGSFQTALAEVGGKPAIAYYNNTRAILQYTRSLVAFPSDPSDWEMHVVDITSSVGLYSAIVVYNGKPAIAYQDQQHNDVRLAQASVAEPASSADWSISTVESDGKLGVDGLCLSVVNGALAITYQNHDTGSLHYAAALTGQPSGESDWAIHSVDTGVNLGKWSSLTLLNGNPAVSYFDSYNSNLKFARALTPLPNSSSDWLVTVVDDSQNIGSFGTSLTIFNDRPLIAYRNDVESCLKVAEALSMLPTTADDWSILSLDPTPSSGYYPSIAVVGGMPAITYNRAGFLAYGNAVP